MKNSASVFFASLCLLAVPSLPGQAVLRAAHTVQADQQDISNDLSVVTGRSVLLDCAQPVQRVAVGTAGIAEATVVSPTEILVNGKAAGETSLILWEKGGSREFFNVTVRNSQASGNDRIETVRRALKGAR